METVPELPKEQTHLAETTGLDAADSKEHNDIEDLQKSCLEILKVKGGIDTLTAEVEALTVRARALNSQSKLFAPRLIMLVKISKALSDSFR